MYKHTYKVKGKELIDFKLLEKKAYVAGTMEIWILSAIFFSFIICSIARSLGLFKKRSDQGWDKIKKCYSLIIILSLAKVMGQNT